MLVFGQGSGPGTFGTYSDSWRWNGATWTQLQTTTVAPPRSFAAAAYDSTLQAVVAFGGGGDDGYLDDTWALAVAPPVQLNAVASRKIHGSAGAFDIDLPLTGTTGIECRSGGPNGAYTLVLTFANPLTSVGSARVINGTGTVSNGVIGSDPHQYLVNLTGVTNAQTIEVSLSSVADSMGSFSSTVSASMNVLAGDTSADRAVNSADISQTKSQSGHDVTSANFREDVTTDGSINSADISLVKSKSGTAIP